MNAPWSRDERHRLYDDSIEHWGEDAQVDMLTEELAELIVAINKYRRKDSLENFNHLAEEFCDVIYMLEEITFLHDKAGHSLAEKSFSTMIGEWLQFKLERTSNRLQESIERKNQVST